MNLLSMNTKGGRRAVLTSHVPLAVALVLALGSPAVVLAQDITGGLYGTAPVAGTVEIRALATGVERVVRPGADGRYSAAALNPGLYNVKVLNGSTVVSVSNVAVVANTMSPVRTAQSQVSTRVSSNAASINAQTLNAVQVSAAAINNSINPIDVSTPQLVSNYSMQLVDDLPMGQSPENIAVLRSNVRYDAQTSGLVQMNGATPAENRYYYNEFDTTNDHTGLGAFYLPPEAIGSTQVLSGNFDASWTNTTGGIMSSTVRQGSNNFQAGYSLYFTPPTSRLLNPRGHNSLDARGDYYSYADANTQGSSSTQYLWASGALVKDKLFFFAMLGNQPVADSTSYSSSYRTEGSTRNKMGLLNVTWNITNDQSLNIVGFENRKSEQDNYNVLNEAYVPSSAGAPDGWSNPVTTNKFLIGNYHWQINDDLGFRLMAGHLGQKNGHDSSSNDANGAPYITSVDPTTQYTTVLGSTNNEFATQPDNFERIGYKGDFTWQLGDHKLVVGAEHYRQYLYESWGTTTGGAWTYFDQPGQSLPNGMTVSNTNGNYVSDYFDDEFGSIYTINKAAYLEDYWQMTDRFMLLGAVRDDIYTYKDAVGNTFFRLPIVSPRLGFSWDVHGDSTLKIGGNLGKYSLALPSNFSFGVAAAQTEWTKYYTYTGVDPTTKLPTGLTSIGTPFVEGNGIPPSANEIGTSNIKAPYQYAWNLYAQQQFNDAWSGSAEIGGVYLKRVINDTCNEDAVTAWAQSNGYPGYVASNTINECFEFNPGENLVLKRDFAGNGGLQTLDIPASAFGITGPKHTYYHLTLDLAHQRTETEPYFLNLSYTFTRSYGNDDGLLDLSRQVDGYIGQTWEYNYPQIQAGSNGNLADDVRHALVASGVYYFKNGLRIGSILNMNSGAPLSCLGSYPDAESPAYYIDSGESHYCNGTLQKRGTAGRLPFFWSLGLSVGYDWKINDRNKMSLDLQVQNVTNRQGIVNRDQSSDTGSLVGNTPVPDAYYGSPTWQAPRTTTLVFRYTY